MPAARIFYEDNNSPAVHVRSPFSMTIEVEDEHGGIPLKYRLAITCDGLILEEVTEHGFGACIGQAFYGEHESNE